MAEQRVPTSPEPTVAGSRDALAAATRDTTGRVALVPTMGGLHDGHRALMRRAAEVADHVVVSVFVNPLQFGSADDLARYPRDLAADVAVCRAEGVSVVWAPTVEVMYPGGAPAITVSSGPLGGRWEGRSRPGHFDGVLTVVAKLFGQVRPQVAVFGEKDFQQLTLVRRMSADLDLGVSIEGVATVRAADGMALSSRASRLSSDGRRSAGALCRALQAGSVAAGHGPAAVRAEAAAVLRGDPAVVLDYLVVVDPATLDEVGADHRGPARILVAAEVEGTRLVDNLRVVCG